MGGLGDWGTGGLEDWGELKKLSTIFLIRYQFSIINYQLIPKLSPVVLRVKAL